MKKSSFGFHSSSSLKFRKIQSDIINSESPFLRFPTTNRQAPIYERKFDGMTIISDDGDLSVQPASSPMP